MKKMLALLLAITMLFALAACGESGSNNQPSTEKDTQTVIGADGSEVTTIVSNEENAIKDLVQASQWGVKTWCLFNNNNKPGIYINFVDPLVTVDEYNIPQPCLAESWSSN